MLANGNTSEELQIPAEVLQPALQRIEAINAAADEVLASNPSVRAGYAEIMAKQPAVTEVEAPKPDFSRPRNMTANEARNAIERLAA